MLFRSNVLLNDVSVDVVISGDDEDACAVAPTSVRELIQPLQRGLVFFGLSREGNIATDQNCVDRTGESGEKIMRQ